MLHQKPDKVTVVIYDPDKTSRSYEINKTIFKKMILSLVLFISILFCLLGYFAIELKRKTYFEVNKFEREQFYLKEREDLLAKIKLLTDENSTLMAKSGEVAQTPTSIPTETPTAIATPTQIPVPTLAQTPSPEVPTVVPVLTPIPSLASSQIDVFTIIKRPIGFKNLKDQNLIKIDNIQLKPSSSGLNLNFDLINNANETKITGYVLVIMRNNNQNLFYPNNPSYLPTMKIPYNIGEQFGFSRMRPVIANFKNKPIGRAQFTILVFTRAGDMILEKSLGPYDIK